MIFTLTILLLGLFIGLPVAIALACSSIAAAFFLLDLPLEFLASKMLGAVYSFPLAAVPLFLLGGELLVQSGFTARLVQVSSILGQKLHLGLASVTIFVAFFLSGLTGAAVAETAALGSVLFPALKKSNYPPAYSATLIAASSTLGPIIPPSIPLIIFGLMAQTSIASLFAAGILPGVLTAAGIFAINLPREKHRKIHREKGTWPKIILKISRVLFPPLILILVMIFGFLTITETAMGFVLLGGIYLFATPGGPAKLPGILLRASLASAQVLIIIACAAAFSFCLTLFDLTGMFSQLLSFFPAEKLGFWITLNLGLFLLGTFLETTAAIYLVVPAVLPIAEALGIPPVHLGIVLVYNLILGMMTPPFGITLFVSTSLSGTPIRSIFTQVWPFLLVGITVLTLLVLFPQWMIIKL
ncbi:MAG: TRAP transporter large permease [Desulfovibrionales bacterium]